MHSLVDKNPLGAGEDTAAGPVRDQIGAVILCGTHCNRQRKIQVILGEVGQAQAILRGAEIKRDTFLYETQLPVVLVRNHLSIYHSLCSVSLNDLRKKERKTSNARKKMIMHRDKIRTQKSMKNHNEMTFSGRSSRVVGRLTFLKSP
jgi:hypothetical protein